MSKDHFSFPAETVSL